MKRVFAIAFLLLLLMYVTGCTSGSADRKSGEADRIRRESAGAHPKREIPLLLTFARHQDEKTAPIEDLAASGLLDTQTGDIDLQEKLLPISEFAGDTGFSTARNSEGPVNEDGTIGARYDGVKRVPIKGGYVERETITAEFRKANGRATQLALNPPLPKNASGAYPLLVSGTPKNFLLLTAYHQPLIGGGMGGGLLLGGYNGLTMRWREVRGSGPSLIADYIPDAVRIGERIYLDGKGGYTAKMIDLTREPLEPANYAPANKLISEVKDSLDAPEIPPLRLTSYKDILLVSVGGNSKIWVWALCNDECIAKVCLDIGEKTLASYKGDKVVDEERFSEKPSGVRLPH